MAGGNLRLTGGRVLTAAGLEETELTVLNGRIAGSEETFPGMETLDVSGLLVLPGFIDLHTHGAYGVDVNAADAMGLRTIGRFFASQGVTGWQCSILTDTEEQTLWCLEQARQVIGTACDGAALLGVHLEGPCLAPEYKGAMPEHLLMKRADPALFHRYQKAAGGLITYVTLSPEVEGVSALIPALRDMGITVAVGHSGATYDQTMACISAGATAATHTANAMRLFHQHEPAIFGAALESDVWCEAICDGLHLHPGAVRLLLKAKGWDKVVAVTDSIMAAGLPDGKYKLGVNDVEVVDGDARLAGGGARAGSTLTMVRALQNLVRFTGRPAHEVCRLMTANPAALMGWRSKGTIAPRMDADLTVLDEQLQVRYTIAAGRIIYTAGEEDNI